MVAPSAATPSPTTQVSWFPGTSHTRSRRVTRRQTRMENRRRPSLSSTGQSTSTRPS